VDNAPPETTLDSGISGHVTSTSASFSFSSPESGVTFECKLDAQAFSACSSPKEYTGLSDGTHNFSVRARDAAGNVDASPVSTQWSIDTTAPTVTDVTPAADATGVAVSDNVTATFSEAMDGTTIYESTFTLSRQGSPTPVTANVRYDRDTRKATLIPAVELEADTLYTVTVEGGANGAKDLAGNPLAEDRVWSFRTAAPPDTAAPTVMKTTPTGKRVSPTAKPTAFFSEKMDEASVEAKDAGGLPTTFVLKKGTSKVAATVSYVEAETATGAKVYKAVLVPSKKLRSGAKYTATVTTAAEDAAGNALDQNPSLAGNQPMT
jgi:hypothetical protein